jgi:2-polyprenyl-6-methoxyphenol hydroxylase-like FAD-dependent oxidoreductase
MVDVLVVGAGPVGLVMAAELRRHGASVRIIDKAAEPLPFCRAIGVTPRTLEVYEQMGIVRPMIEAGVWLEGVRVEVNGSARTPHVDLSDLPYGALGIPQPQTERILTAHLASLGVKAERGLGFVSLEQGEESVQVTLAGADGASETVEVAYVVGCDGAHSAVRRALGITFEGEAFPYPFMLGDVHVQWPAEAELSRGYALRAMLVEGDEPPDLFIAVPLPEHGRYRVTMMADPQPEEMSGDGVLHGIQTDRSGMRVEALQAVADRVMVHSPKLSDLRWSSRFRISMRLATKYRVGRAFIAGDAAHIHPPTGGQGMNTGIQDAFNLAWKLGLVLSGHAGAGLLDSYESERRPVAQGVLARTTEETVNLGRQRTPPHRLADTQILLSYRGGEGFVDHGAVPPDAVAAGDRAPDAQGLRQRGFGFPERLFELMSGTEHVLLVTTAPDASALTQFEAEAKVLQAIGVPLRIVGVVPREASRPDGLPQPYGLTLVHDIEGTYEAAYSAAPGAAFLVRPDGYIAWTARPLDVDALTRVLRDIAAR